MSNLTPPPPPSMDPGQNFASATGDGADASLAPLGVDYETAFRRAFSKYSTFNGRASRSEYWKFALINLGIEIGLLILSALSGNGGGISSVISSISSIAYVVWILAAFIPNLALLVRRLHDTDHSGWFYWIALIPIVGIIVLVVALAKTGDVFANRYGPAA